MKRYLLLSLLLLIFANLSAQPIAWNSQPHKGFVFQITNAEAQTLVMYHGVSEDGFYKLLYNQVDTFDVRKGWKHTGVKQGHFILAEIKGERVDCRYQPVFPYQVFLFKEYDALALQVLDMEGNIRKDAVVKLGKRRLRMDSQTKTYRLPNHEVRQSEYLATVDLEGFRSVFGITKHEVPTWENDHYDEEDTPEFYSYMVTDKNRYKPGEQVRFKSYALSSSKTPIRRKLELYLNGYGLNKKIADVEPHRPGSFAHEFRLHDSLRLSLDRTYTLSLRDKQGRWVATSDFRYEDYELFGNKLEVKLATADQYYPQANTLSIQATSENGLPLKDAKAYVLVRPVNILASYESVLTMPDTLLYRQLSLNPVEPTLLEIPSELFGKSNTGYTVSVVVLNADNERLEATEQATHYFSKYEPTYRMVGDSIELSILSMGETLEGVDAAFSSSVNSEPRMVRLPYAEKLNPAAEWYSIVSRWGSKTVYLSNLSDGLELLGGVTDGKLAVELSNPLQLDVTWYIYYGSELLKKEAGRELKFEAELADFSQTCYVEALYTFGGTDRALRRQFTLKEDFLNVKLNLPERVYPGQTTKATIKVTDTRGSGVSKVDLTAFAVTAKLNYSVPDLPYFGAVSKPRSKKAHYSMDGNNSYSKSLPLRYDFWNDRARLDTMMYYRYTYPQGQLFEYSVPTPDSTTQLAPFIMENGLVKTPHVVVINGSTAFFSFAQQPQGYSFVIDGDKKQQIVVRTADAIYMFDSMSFEKGKKTILSINALNHPYKWVSARETGSYFSTVEKRYYEPQLARFDIQGGAYSYVYDAKEFIPLSYKTSRANTIIVGPIRDGEKTYVSPSHSITYDHEHGYRYQFKNNVVYKRSTDGLLPYPLSNSTWQPLARVNEFAITQERYMEDKDKEPSSQAIWNPSYITTHGGSVKLSLGLPSVKVKEQVGIATLLLQDVATGRLIGSHQDRQTAYFGNVAAGMYNLYILYRDGEYFKHDSLAIRRNATMVVDMRTQPMQPATDSTIYWLSKFHMEQLPRENTNAQDPLYPYLREYQSQAAQQYVGKVRGRVYDKIDGQPLPYISILVKGTTIGVLTDEDGRFEIGIPQSPAVLQISFIGYITEEVKVRTGEDIVVQLSYASDELSEVVIVGYGSTQRSASIGYSVTTTGEDSYKEEVGEADEADEVQQAEAQLYAELLTLSGLRKNFSDVGFWEPRLYTDRKGEASFSVTFPDDITRWDAVVYAMNNRAQTGTGRLSIKSYKPLMGELHVPQFLTLGDSANFVGKVLNYTTDTLISGRVAFSGATDHPFEKEIRFAHAHTDLLPVVAVNTDTLTTRYLFTRADGYTDGEERGIPVVKQGTERIEGSIDVLMQNESATIATKTDERAKIEISPLQLGAYVDNISYLISYQYACNEQLASKLAGLINHKRYQQFIGEAFTHDKEVNGIIRRLADNQNNEYLWSWWNRDSETSYWMSAHILRSLKLASDEGYIIPVSIEDIQRRMNYHMYYSDNLFEKIDLLQALAMWGAKLDYTGYLPQLDSLLRQQVRLNTDLRTGIIRDTYRASDMFRYQLLLLETRQLTNVGYSADSLLAYKKQLRKNEVFFGIDAPQPPMQNYYSHYSYNSNNLIANLSAYRMVGQDSTLTHLRQPMQLFILSTYNQSRWNTYTASSALMTVLPDLLADGSKLNDKPTVQLAGKVNRVVDSFPCLVQLAENDLLTITHKGALPLFVTTNLTERVVEAKKGMPGLDIQTWLSKEGTLTAGEPVQLIVEVEVSGYTSLNHVMVDVPIPASCSYANRNQSHTRYEAHREYFKERTVIFCSYLSSGKHRFTIDLIPRYTGTYGVNPAKAELMYVPAINANTDMKRVEVTEK